MLLERMKLLVPGSALYVKRKNTFFGEHVKTANFKQN